MIRCVTFDFTGTLANFARAPASVYFERLQTHLPALREDAMRRSFKAALKAQSAHSKHFGGAQQLSSMQWWLPVIDNAVTAALDDSDADAVQIESSRRAWREQAETLGNDLLTYFTTDDAYRICSGAKECLQNLHAQNIPLGVLSNNDKRLHLILDNLQLTPYFAFVLTSHEAAASKPSNDFFNVALARAAACGVQSPRQVLHVGDDKDKDCNGAIEAGMNAVLLDETAHLSLNEAVEQLQRRRWTTLPSLHMLPDLINKSND